MSETTRFRLGDRHLEGAGVWAAFAPVLVAGDTYDLPRDWGDADALDYWFAPGNVVFVAERDEAILGSSFLRPNGLGGGAHVANAGFVVAEAAQGLGLGRMLALHTMAEARARGFAAMQFNHVISTNERAVALWTDLGFTIVGRSPRSFRLPNLECADQLIMHADLT